MAEHSHKKEHKKNKILLGFEEYEALKKKADESSECFDKLLRLQAEFDNYKKRLEKDKQGFVKFANEEIIIEVLNILGKNGDSYGINSPALCLLENGRY